MGARERALRAAALQHAIKWISRRLQEAPGRNRAEIIDEACREFSLTPLQGEFLYQQFGRMA